MEPVPERPARIPESLWESLSPEFKLLVYELCEENRQLLARIRDIEARSKQNSSNSSLPSSQDRPWDKPVKRKKARGGKRGGQKGHPPHLRQLIPAERVQHVENHYPSECRHCSSQLQNRAEEEGADDFQRHQVVELPEITPQVTEHRLQ